MKVYLVEWDNCEPWEDAMHMIIKAFSTKEKAIYYIENEEFALKDDKREYWLRTTYECTPKGSPDSDDVASEMFCNIVPEGYMIWWKEQDAFTIIEMEVG